MRDRNATRSIDTQRVIKVSLKGKAGFNEFCEECDAANPLKAAQTSKLRCIKDEMHGRETSSRRPWFTQIAFSHTVSSDMHCDHRRLMKCADVAEPMQELHAKMGGSEPFFQSAVAADLVQIEQLQHLSAELSVSLLVKETFVSDI